MSTLDERARTLDELAVRMDVWQTRNFPNATLEQLALGVNEEICHELGESLATDSRDDIFDAIGDAAIYLINLFNTGKNKGFFSKEKNIKEIVIFAGRGKPTKPNSTLQCWMALSFVSGRISRSILKTSQGIRGHFAPNCEDQIGAALLLLGNLIEIIDPSTDLEKVVGNIWDTVEKRDWVKYSGNGVSK